MELTFALQNGTRVGVHPSEAVLNSVLERRCMEQSSTVPEVAVIFHVPSKEALDRVMERFGVSGC